MGKNKSDGKAKGKGSQLVIRIEKAEREAFVSLCEQLDTSAAREIRRFMRGFVAAHAQKRGEAVNGAPAVAAAGTTPEVTAPDPAPLLLTEPLAAVVAMDGPASAA